MPKSKRNKTVDLSKTKKHGLEGKKELYKKIQSNVENYAHVFLFAVNDMRNSKMKNVREQWKHSRFCIGKNKVMAMALGRTPEEEYRPNLHKIGQMLIGETGLFFTNQSVDEVTNWFESYSEGDFARSGNTATEDVVLPEGPLAQFPHNQESYLRQLGLPTTLKKGVIHLIKEHVVCREGDRLSPETARILKLLGYEMAEFRINILSVWSQDGSFTNLQSDSHDPESKENAAYTQKSFMNEDFELAKDCILLGDDDDMEIIEIDSEDKNKISNNSEEETNFKSAQEDLEAEIVEVEVVKQQTSRSKSSLGAKENSRDVISLENNSSCDLEKKQELDSEDKNKISNNSKKETNFKSAQEDLEADIVEVEVVKPQTSRSKSSLGAKENSRDVLSLENNSSCDLEKKQELEMVKLNFNENKAKAANKGKQNDIDEASKNNTNGEENALDESENDEKGSNPTNQSETEDVEMEEEILEPEVKKPKNNATVRKSGKKTKKTVNKQVGKGTDEQTNDITNNETVSPEEKIIDNASILKLTEKKLEESAEKPKKFSPKMTRARAAAANKKIKPPEPVEMKKTTRKRKM